MSEQAQAAVLMLSEQVISAMGSRDWARVLALTDAILLLDPDNHEATVFRRTAVSLVPATETSPAETAPAPASARRAPARIPASGARTGTPSVHRHSHEIDDIVRSVSELVPFSAVATRLLQMLDDELADGDDIARLAATEPALSGRILRAANSAYYQRRTRVATIREALVVLGSREVRSLVVASCLLGTAPRTNFIEHDAFWRFSLVVGVLADLIAHSQRSISGEAFTAGVMHNIGLLALDMYCPQGLEEVSALSGPGLRRLHDRETAVFGFTDADVGARLAASWRLPRPVVDAIASHGLRADEFKLHQMPASAVVRAHIFARAHGLNDGMEEFEPRTVTDEWLHAPVNQTLSGMGGWEGFLDRIDGFFESVTRDP